MEWGEAIEVNGVRPDWLRDDEVVDWSHHKSSGRVHAAGLAWADQPGYDNAVKAIRLPADHPYYTVQAHNAKHGTNFAYWPGGDNAPDDWDGGPVLNRGGDIFEDARGMDWRDCHFEGRPSGGDIIGYTRPCTREERFTQETGITVTLDVRAALEWKE